MDYTTAVIPADRLESRLADVGRTHQRLAGLSEVLRDVIGHPELVEVFLDAAARRAVVVTEEELGATGAVAYRVDTMPADAFCERYEVDDVVDEYRRMVEAGQGARRSFGFPDLADLPVPAARLVREGDAVLGRPQPDPGYTPARVLATTLEELVDLVPGAENGQPTIVLTLTDPETGDDEVVDLPPIPAELVSKALGLVLETAYATRNRYAGLEMPTDRRKH